MGYVSNTHLRPVVIYYNVVVSYYDPGPGQEHRFCCDAKQINDLLTSFGQALNLVARCPSCARNLRMIFCSMTCDPHHSRFIMPNETEHHDTAEPETNSTTVIKSLNYYIRDSYVTAMYDSCKEVTNPSSNSLVMPTICGQWGEDCTPHRYVCSIHAVGQTQDSNRCFVSGLDCWTLWVKVSPMVDSRHLTFISSTSRMIMSSAKGSSLSTLKLFRAPSPLA